MTAQLIRGDARTLPLATGLQVDAIVTDPPSSISFMGSTWDSDLGGRTEWVAWLTDVMRGCFDVLRPGGHALVWALPRRSHWTALALEDAGFEIREKVYHLFGSGFPKSKNLGNGWGSALKPGAEEWILARKPLAEKTLAANVRAHGVGGINIDGCRLDGTWSRSTPTTGDKRGGRLLGSDAGGYECGPSESHPAGRWPANLVLSHNDDCEQVGSKRVRSGVAGPQSGKGQWFGSGQGSWIDEARTTYADPDGLETVATWQCEPSCAVALLDAQSGDRPASYRKARTTDPVGATYALGRTDAQPFGHHDTGGTSRFFYTAKPSQHERSAGLAPGERSDHPTVKSIALMRWLCRLITPPGGTVLDCFMGSGTTGCAAVLEGFNFIGVERDAHYIDIARRRIAYWAAQGRQTDMFAELPA